MYVYCFLIIYFIVYILDHVDHENPPRDSVGVMSIIRLRNKTKWQPFKTIVFVDFIVIKCKYDIAAYYKVTYDIIVTLYCYYYLSMQFFHAL